MSAFTPGYWSWVCWRCSGLSRFGELIMATFLDSIGYNEWVLPALLVIPLIGGVIVLMVPVRNSPATDGGVESPAARQVAFWFFGREFLESIGFWRSLNPNDAGLLASI